MAISSFDFGNANGKIQELSDHIAQLGNIGGTIPHGQSASIQYSDLFPNGKTTRMVAFGHPSETGIRGLAGLNKDNANAYWVIPSANVAITSGTTSITIQNNHGSGTCAYFIC